MSELYQKTDHGLLLPFAKQLTGWVMLFIPTWVKPNHVTILGFSIGVSIAILYYLASFNKLWLLVTPLFIFMRWLIDNLDGELARARNQTSDQGFFLDLFLDNVSFTIVSLAIGLASYSIFELWAIAQMISLLRAITILFRILLKKQFILPAIGPDEFGFILISVTILGFIWHGNIFQIGSYSFSCFDIFVLLFIPVNGFELIKFAWELYNQLEEKNEVSPALEK